MGKNRVAERLLPRKWACAVLTGLVCVMCTAAQVPANKPTTATQVPSATGTIATKPTENTSALKSYVRTWDAMGRYTDIATFQTDASSATGYQNIKQTTQYVDGLGRPLQTVARQASPGSTPKDIVAPVVYDVYGRENFKYLPYVQSSGTTNDGNYKATPFTDQDYFYKTAYKDANNVLMVPGEQALYSRTEYEPSPLNRVSKTFAAGNTWSGSYGSASEKAINIKYMVNTATTDAVRIWNITSNALTYTNNDVTTNIPTTSAAYADGTLYKMVTLDEQGNAVVEYKDRDGKVILKKVQAGAIAADYSGYSGFLCTYYIYDDLNQLRFVIPPKAVAAILSTWLLPSDVINELCFRYEYDSRQRVSAKKVPGAGWVYMIYDVRDRPVFSQDANMRNNNQWMTTLYDALNRPVITGITVYSGTPAALQSAVTTQTTTPGSPNTGIPIDLDLNSTMSGTQNPQALRSITLNTGFDYTAAAAVFETFIVPGPSGPDGETTSIEGTAVNKNPIPPGSSFTSLTANWYDNYDWSPKIFTAAFNASLDAGTNLHAETMPSQPFAQVIGLTTTVRTRVITDPNNLAAGGWEWSVMYYDDRDRVIQTQTDNYKGGNDVVANRYDFSGKILSSYSAHINPAIASVNVKTNYEYDYAGRLLKTYKTINDDAAKKALIANNSYDDLGNLLQKQLGQTKDASGNYTTTPIETLNYNYNIRGWLKGINKDYANNVNNVNWFGMELNYDWGFGTNAFNGNIAGVKWHAKGDDQLRAYGFTYDRLNRLMSGDFSQYSGSSYADNSLYNFDMMMGIDGIDATQAYDENGNIKKMQQWGLKLGSGIPIDNLNYNYYTNSNKLSGVTDLVTTDNKLGDFTDKNTSGNDYGYDKNGNLIADINKRINGTTGIDQTTGGAIIYNHLNLPWQITVKNDAGTATKGVITYIYNATGIKQSKAAVEYGATVNYNGTNYTSDITTTTIYIGSFVYESKTYSNGSVASLGYTEKLSFFAHEEGRARFEKATTSACPALPDRFVYDYFIKDHLGNTRTVLTDQSENICYIPATVEDASWNTEKNYYDITDSRRMATNTITGIPASFNGKTYQTHGNIAGQKTGLGLTLKVMAGDKVKLFAESFYTMPSGGNPGGPFNMVLSDLLTSFAGSGAVNATKGAVTATDVQNIGTNNTDITNFITRTPATYTAKAYLNWILFDDQLKYVASGTEAVGTSTSSGGTVYKQHIAFTNSPINITKSGFFYVFVSNESNLPVFFDNLSVTHTPGPLLEETQYYPFGLTMAGISSKAIKNNYTVNKYLFNGGNELQSKEFSDGSGLEVFDALHRAYDPQIGRFWQVDELAEFNWEESSYSFAHNDPILFNDPIGLDPEKGLTPGTAKELQGVTVVGVRGLWPSTRLYYQLMDLTKGNLGRIVNNSLREKMYRIDGIVNFRERVNDMTHQSDLIIWGTFFAPIVGVEAGFVWTEAQISALLSDAPHILKYLGDKKYTQAIRGILRLIARRMPVKNLEDFERLGKILNEIDKNRDLLKDLKTINEIKKLIETIFKIKI